MCCMFYETPSLKVLGAFHSGPFRPIQFENTLFHPLLNYSTWSNSVLTVFKFHRIMSLPELESIQQKTVHRRKLAVA